MSSALRRPRIVLADDHPSVLDAFSRMLQPSCDVVETVQDGRAAIDAVRRLQPDVLVVDLMMPDLDGLEVCRQVKQMAPATDIVLVTAFDDTDVQALALREGASAFVPKHSATSLEETVHRVFAERQGVQERIP